MKVKVSVEREGNLSKSRKALKVKESVKVSLRETLKKNRVTLDVTAAWKSREALKVKESVESQGKR